MIETEDWCLSGIWPHEICKLLWCLSFAIQTKLTHRLSVLSRVINTAATASSYKANTKKKKQLLTTNSPKNNIETHNCLMNILFFLILTHRSSKQSKGCDLFKVFMSGMVLYVLNFKVLYLYGIIFVK